MVFWCVLGPIDGEQFSESGVWPIVRANLNGGWPVLVHATGDLSAGFKNGPNKEPLAESIKQKLKQFASLWGELLPMCSLFFFMAFVNTILDSLKDTLVITAAGGGAQDIPYLTVYAVLPASLVFVLAFTYASHHIDRAKLFNWIIALFGAFNLFFALVLYPNHRSLHLYGLSSTLSSVGCNLSFWN